MLIKTCEPQGTYALSFLQHGISSPAAELAKRKKWYGMLNMSRGA